MKRFIQAMLQYKIDDLLHQDMIGAIGNSGAYPGFYKKWQEECGLPLDSIDIDYIDGRTFVSLDRVSNDDLPVLKSYALAIKVVYDYKIKEQAKEEQLKAWARYADKMSIAAKAEAELRKLLPWKIGDKVESIDEPGGDWVICKVSAIDKPSERIYLVENRGVGRWVYAEDIRKKAAQFSEPQNEPIATFKINIQEAADRLGAEIINSYDDLDYLNFVKLELPSSGQVVLMQHDQLPVPGLDLCVIPADSYPKAVLTETVQLLNLKSLDVTWMSSKIA